jgi:hypothetical protein
MLNTNNPADIALIKSLLYAAGIKYFFHGEHFTYVRPLADPARLMVKKDEVELARDLPKKLNLSLMGISLEKKPE